MTTEQNKAVVRRFFEAFGANDQEALKGVLTPDVAAYTHIGSGPVNREALLQGIGMWNSTFNDTRFTIEEQIAEGDRVATRTTMYAVHSGGDFQGLAPTGKEVAVRGITINRIRDGRIVEHRVNSDFLGLMQQLGLVPPPASA
jgi:predicted ester cyclase